MGETGPNVVYGIHLGNTSACLAISRDGRIEVVANDSGDRLTPSIVAYTDREVLVGIAAKQQAIRNATNTIIGAKGFLGKVYNKEFKSDTGQLQVIDKSGKPAFEVELKGKKISPSSVEVTAEIFKDLMKLGQSNTGSNSKSVVITTPCSSSKKFDLDLIAAAKAAGCDVLRLIKEPVASILAYGIGEERSFEPELILVCRIGGTSAEASLVSVQSGLIRIVKSESRDILGGKRLTDIVVKLLATEFQRKTKLDPLENKRSRMKLQNGAEVTKNILSTLGSAQCSIESLIEGIDMNLAVTRARYESLISQWIQDCLSLLRAVAETGPSNKVRKIVLCGAVAKTPALQTAVRSAFPCAKLLDSIAQDEVLAYGCAVQASLINGDISCGVEDCEFSCLGSSIYVRSEEESEPRLLFSKLSPVGFSRQTMIFDSPAESSTFSLEILEEALLDEDLQIHLDDKNGETIGTKLPLSKSNLVVIAVVKLKDISFDYASVTLTSHLKKDGGLSLSLIEKKSGRSESISIDAST